MKASLQSRLAKLESQTRAKETMTRGGVLILLPEDYVGEKHVVLGSRMSTDWPDYEWCTFQEVPGPGRNEAEGANVIPIAYADRNL
jgi:hypothetical protein